MERRFITFITLSVAILVTFQIVNFRLNPPAPEPDGQAAAEGQVAPERDNGEQPQGEAAPLDDVKEPDHPDAVATGEASETPEDVEPADQPAVELHPKVDVPQSWVAVGSLNPDSDYRMLVWFNSQGGTIECVALNQPRYKDIEYQYGFPGYLAPSETPDGVRINAVGDGTPAAAATPTTANAPVGLAAGDLIDQLDGQSIVSLADYHRVLEATKPGATLPVRVRRGPGKDPIDYEVQLIRHPLLVIRPEPKRPTDDNPRHPYSYRMTLQQLGDHQLKLGEEELPGLPSLLNGNWQSKPITTAQGDGVEFQFVLTPESAPDFGLTGPLRIIKRFVLGRVQKEGAQPKEDPATVSDEPSPAYDLRYEVEILNEGTEPLKVAYQQDGPTGLPLEGWWYVYKTHPTKFSGAGVRDVVFRPADGKHQMFANSQIVKRIKANPQNPDTPMIDAGPFTLQYAGVDGQYFTSALVADRVVDADGSERVPQFSDALARAVGPIDPIKTTRTDVSFRLKSTVETLEPGGGYRQPFRVFAGPKDSEVLAAYGLQECITYGWFPFVAKPLQFVLHTFYAVVRNYGVAIILLTVMVRGLMFPIGRQQALNAQKMQELAPEMKRIAELYKTDLEKRSAAQRELFRKHNYNPLAGCLPVFFQLPIFVGLYRALSVDINLRLAPLIPGIQWCNNLAAPDQFLYWESFMPAMLASPTGWLGPYLNILPLISVGLMIVHQRMFTPPATDEQQQMQQRVMSVMMLFFGFMFFRVPAGLCLYFITSSLWGLAERMLLPKPAKSKESTAAKSATTSSKVSPRRGNGGGRAGKSSGGSGPAGSRKRK